MRPGCRAIVNLPAAQGSRGRFLAAMPFCWGTSKFSPNKIGGEEPLDLLVPALLGRANGRGEPRLRHSALEGLHDFKTWAEESAAQGYHPSLPAARRRGNGHPL